MSSEPAVHFDAVTKTYRFRSGGAAIRDLLRSRSAVTFDALHDVSFEIEQGESVGFIGPNGAGKSTALRLMSRISRPTHGTITVNGSIGALLEVGSGIHYELTARENIWMYGNILGMRRAQIARRFDAIVDFAELGRVLDQQVKFFSSGMQLRLGFAIAAHLDPQILIVDEALAVGDERFQRRCIEHMSSLTESNATVVYVSHDLKTVETICDRVIWLHEGRTRAMGSPSEILGEYIRSVDAEPLDFDRLDQSGNRIRIDRCTVDIRGKTPGIIRAGEPVEIELEFVGEPADGPLVAVGINPLGPDPLIVCSMAEHGPVAERVGERWVCRLTIEALPLRSGTYEVWCSVLTSDATTSLFHWTRVARLRVENPSGKGVRALSEIGPVVVDHRFYVTDPIG